MFSVILRKSYGLGALAMTGGSYPASVFAVAWPTAEFGGRGLEGSEKLAYRNEMTTTYERGDTRRRIGGAKRSLPPRPVRRTTKLRWIDAW
jgi:acetyl-CoA carboxylase carboxyltransferase component